MFALLLCFSVQQALAQGPLKIMYYNVLNFPGSTPGRADTLRIIIDHDPPDILVINELISEKGADLILSKSLPEGFKRAVFKNGPDTDNMLFYDADKVSLKSQSQIATELRDISEYVVHWNDIAAQDDTTFLALYSVHLKASQGSENETKRKLESEALVAHLKTVNPEYHVIVGGDFNFYDGNEAGYRTLANVLVDPLASLGKDWHNEEAYVAIHTQSTRLDQFNGGATGGMDDRFDFIWMDKRLTSNSPVFFVENSYQTIGQDGKRFNGSMIDPLKNDSVPNAVATALYQMSDHLPILVTIGRVEHAGSIGEKEFSLPHQLIGDQLVLELDDEFTMTMIDLQGRLIQTRQLRAGQQTIDLGSLRAQEIIVRLESDEKAISFIVPKL